MNTIFEQLGQTPGIGDHVLYWYEGERRSGVIRYFSGDRQTAYIKDDVVRRVYSVQKQHINRLPTNTTA